jgi:hypothetical protein
VDGKHEVDGSPWHVRAWGFVLVLFGLLNILGSLGVRDSRLAASDWLILSLITAAGFGLIGQYRWGWLLGVVVGSLGITSGIWLLVDAWINGLAITLIGLPYFAVFMLVIPGALLLFSLLSPGARHWLRAAS